MKLPKIFVSTCGYNERFIKETIASALDLAEYPDRVSFGIFNQKSSGVPMDDLSGFKNVRVQEMVHNEPIGVGHARLNASLLYEGERFYCQVDSHNLFAKDWDTKCVDFYTQLSTIADRPLIAQSPNWHHAHQQASGSYSKGWSEYALVGLPLPLKLTEKGNTEEDRSRADEPRLLGQFLEHYSLTANGFFTSADFIYDVSHIPFVRYFCEQEMSALRAWTRGYRFFSTDTPLFSTMTKMTVDGKIDEDNFPGDSHSDRKAMMKNARMTWEYITGRKFGWYGAPNEEIYNRYIEVSGNDLRNADYQGANFGEA